MVLAAHPNPSSPVLSHFSLVGKTALVTGGTRGIGLEVARGLAEAGATVAILYTSTSPSTADETAASISQSTGQIVKAYKCNVTSQPEIESVMHVVAKELGGGSLDVVVANAGIATHYAGLDYTPEQFKEIMDVNLNGAFYTAQAAGRIFEKQVAAGGKNGNVVFTASVSAILVNVPQKQAAYNASKAAVVQLARCLSVEWVDFARVNCVSPGFIATDMLEVHPEEWRKKWFGMIPAARLCEPAELKGAYVFCASDASSYMTGANLVIDGGYTLP
ncbi:short chain dehydrogenase reductase [Tricladium varicosporioides]|nr:short chain dehydrogenase reductase [Hymenoscyphus varicosporioides]